MTGSRARPMIRHNDFSPLKPAAVGRWTPKLSVSVVIPAHGGQHRLDLTLAALSAQTYPADLVEVLVVDDGSDPPLRLPEIRPENTRLVPAAPDGWGPGHAINSGVQASGGTVIQRLDADMVIHRDHLETLMRWHHLTDYVVAIGAKQFVEEPAVTAGDVRRAVLDDVVDEIVDMSRAIPSSTEKTIVRLDGLRRSKNPYHVCTGPTVSLHRSLFDAAGAIDPLVIRGEDTEFAYRLAQQGAVFVPDLEAKAVHLGLPAQRRDRTATVRAVQPYLAQRIPLRRDLRKDPGRGWLVPYVEVVLDVGDATERETHEAVRAALSGTLPDVSVTLVAPWSKLPAGRHSVLTDPAFELRMLREGYRHDPRVRLADEVTPTAAPAPFRYIGPIDVPLEPASLEGMIERVTGDRLGVLKVAFADGHAARLERTEAVGRALLVAAPGEPLDEVIEETHGVRHSAAASFWPAREQKEPCEPAETRAAQPRPRGKRLTPLRDRLGRFRRSS
ncbi:glycosyltransferase family 2 protein [Planotetraspora sp. GP83]|uniref:glycosyltransferase n=1 Tax=Planotetraspora sp. GP83 TaxID=3156264 RepID=UPI0035137470